MSTARKQTVKRRIKRINQGIQNPNANSTKQGAGNNKMSTNPITGKLRRSNITNPSTSR